MILFYILTVFSIILYAVYYYSKRKFSYWKQQNVPHLEPTPIFGNYKDYILMNTTNGEAANKICLKFPNEPYVGTFYGTEPALLVKSPELLKLVTTKDFYYFSSREVSNYTHRELMTQAMFFTYGDRWRILRQNSSALFSTAKLKTMFCLVEKCARQFESVLDKEANPNSVEIRSILSRFTIDVIGLCIFGVHAQTMTKEKGNPFKRMGYLVFRFSFLRALLLVTRAIWPAIFYGLRFRIFPLELTNFFNKLLTDIFKARNYEASGRNDFVDLMMTLKKNGCVTGDSMMNMKTDEKVKVSLEVDDVYMVPLSVNLFAAGFETTSTTISFMLYELAKNEDAQKRGLREVDAFMLRHKNKLEYECISELPFLEACVDETLRLYPVLPHLAREVVEDYTLPSGVLLKKGLRVHLPIYHLHRNAEYFPEPEKFRPERFYGEEKRKIIPYTYMPFGMGPRNCIGMRFARMTIMAALITILKSYRVELAAGMSQSILLEPQSLVTTPRSGIYLRLVPRPGRDERVFAP